VRYYEKHWTAPPGAREGHGQHYYTEETLARLRKIDQLKKLGLSLDEIRDVIDLYFHRSEWNPAPNRKSLPSCANISRRRNRRSGRWSNFVLIYSPISSASSAGLRTRIIPSFFASNITLTSCLGCEPILEECRT